MSVMQLHLDMLEAETADDLNGSFEALQRKIEEVVSTSTMARRIDELDSKSLDDGPVDVVSLIEDRIRIIRGTHPDVTVSLDLPDEAWAAVGPIFESVIDNIVENAIEHHDGVPLIDITVEPPASNGSTIRIRVTDDGPGMPGSEIQLLRDGDETQLEHSNGLGLWLVKWIVEHYGGDIRFETPSGGTRVILDIPAAAARAEASRSQTHPTP